MSNPKGFWNYLGISTHERRGILVIFGICIFLIGYKYYQSQTEPVIVYSQELNKADSLEKSFGYSPKKSNQSSYDISEDKSIPVKNQLFVFNPNTISYKELILLGVPQKVSATWISYRNHGAVFKYKQDIQKVHGLQEGLYQTLSPYIQLPDKEIKEQVITTNSNPAKETVVAPSYPKKELIKVEINSADSALLTELKGIGAVFATRILEYRKKLGGFYKREQLLEVWGMDSDRYQLFIPQVELDKSQLSKININTVTVDRLKRHPYLRWKEAQAIINYRNANGNYKEVTDLQKVILLSEESYNKIFPYLKVE